MFVSLTPGPSPSLNRFGVSFSTRLDPLRVYESRDLNKTGCRDGGEAGVSEGPSGQGPAPDKSLDTRVRVRVWYQECIQGTVQPPRPGGPRPRHYTVRTWVLVVITRLSVPTKSKGSRLGHTGRTDVKETGILSCSREERGE